MPRRHVPHPSLRRPVPPEQIEAELYELWARSGLGGGYLLAWTPQLSRAHRRSSRRYAQVLIDRPPRFEFAPQMVWLPKANRIGLLAHEIGHVLRPGSEQDADDAAEEVLGVPIGYDLRWPGKGLQSAMSVRANPWRENRARRELEEAQQSLFRGSQLGHRFGLSKVLTVGESKRGEDRVWLEGNWLQDLGYDIGQLYDVTYDPGSREVRLALAPRTGKRKVSKHKRGKRQIPVIDLTNRAVTDTLLGADSVVIETKAGEIIIRPASVPRMIAERQINGLEGSVFTGAGFLSESAAMAGYEAVWGIEVETRNAAVFAANHARAIPIALPVQEAVLLNYQMATLGRPILEQVELLTGGIPCQPFSRGWRGKWLDPRTGEVLTKSQAEKVKGKRTRQPKDHDLISMTHWFISVVQQVNPLNVLVEQVEHYLDSESFAVLRDALEIMGYKVQSAVFDSNAMGSVAGRRRAVVIGTTSRAFDLASAITPEPQVRTAAEVLLPPEEIDARMAAGWFGGVDEEGGVPKSPLFKHPKAQGAWFSLEDPPGEKGKGGRTFGPGAMLNKAWKRKGHKPTIITPDTVRVGAIKKTYHRVQPDGVYVAHPANRGTPSKPAPGDRYRMFLVEEIKRLHGVPDDYQLPERYSDAVEVLGQGVVVDAFAKLIARLPRNKARAHANPAWNPEHYAGAWFNG